MRKVVMVVVSLVALLLALLVAGGIMEWLGFRRIERNIEHMAILRDRARRSPADSNALNALISAVDSNDRFERTAAIAFLGQIGSNAAPAVKVLIGVLNNHDPYDAREAASTLGEIGPGAMQAVPDLTRAIQNHPHEDIGWFAAESLGHIVTTNDVEVVATLKQAAKSSDELMRDSANEGLQALGITNDATTN
jgi:HEAT repeat protein